MIQIDMPMPTNCLDCPACNEYLMCAIPINGRKWGENDVHEFGQGRPEWCPMKEQESKWIHRADMDYKDKNGVVHFHGMCESCGFIHDFLDEHTGQYKFCPECGSKNEQWKDGDGE